MICISRSKFARNANSIFPRAHLNNNPPFFTIYLYWATLWLCSPFHIERSSFFFFFCFFLNSRIHSDLRIYLSLLTFLFPMGGIDTRTIIGKNYIILRSDHATVDVSVYLDCRMKRELKFTLHHNRIIVTIVFIVTCRYCKPSMI